MVHTLLSSIEREMKATPLQSRMVGVGRSIIALAQLSFLLFTPTKYFLIPVGGVDLAGRCSSHIAVLSAFCLSDQHEAVRYTLCLLLIVIASGFMPRWTSFLHFWVSYSIATTIGLPDGGESAASAITFFYCFASQSDNRTWHWQEPGSEHETTIASGVAWAGSWILRAQMSLIYLWGGLSKLAVETWQDGTALYYVTRMEFFGSAGLFANSIHFLTGIPLVTLCATWGTIVLEVSIAILLLLNNRRAGVIALILCIFVHTVIIVMIGIVSFGLIMIGGVAMAASYSICRNQLPPEAAPQPDVLDNHSLVSS